MKVSFRLVNGKMIDFEVEPNEAFYEIIIKLAELLQVPAQTIKLVYKSQSLIESKKVSDIPLTSGAVIQVLTVKKPSANQNTSHSFSQKTVGPKRPASTGTVKQSKSAIKHQQALPPRSGPMCRCQDPPHFDDMVKMLMEMGFEKEKCEQALRASFYNSDRAAEYLIEDSIPAEVCNDVKLLQKQRDELCLRDDINPNERVACVYDKLKPDQKDSILKLESLGFDRETVIQVYIACEKDVSVATSCLLSMNL